jgi:hypothetical protein
MIDGVTKGTSVVEMLYDGVGVGPMTAGDIISITGATGAIMIMIAGSCSTSLSRVLDFVGAGRTRIRTASLRTSLSILLISMTIAQSALFNYFFNIRNPRCLF